MSHIAKIKTQMKDPAMLEKACQLMKASYTAVGSAQIYSVHRSGQVINLPGWRFPIVVDPKTGELHYDNYGGSWGSMEQIDRLTQNYAKLTAMATLRKAGHRVIEQSLPDGSVRLIAEVEA